MEEIFEGKLLNDLYETRRDDFERKYGESKILKKVNNAEENFRKTLEKIINDDNIKSVLLKKFCDFEEKVVGEMMFWNRQYYKLGFTDSFYLKNEIRDNRKKELSQESNEIYYEEEFLRKCDDNIYDIIQSCTYEMGKSNNEYEELNKQKKRLEEKYPNICGVLFDEELISLSKEEMEALLKYIRLENETDMIEKLMIFKLGIREGTKI